MKLALSRRNLAGDPREARARRTALQLASVPLLLGPAFPGARARSVAEAQWWPAEGAREYKLERLRQVRDERSGRDRRVRTGVARSEHGR